MPSNPALIALRRLKRSATRVNTGALSPTISPTAIAPPIEAKLVCIPLAMVAMKGAANRNALFAVTFATVSSAIESRTSTLYESSRRLVNTAGSLSSASKGNRPWP